MLEKGIKGQEEITVNENNTAEAMGSGSLAVFATPAMIALMDTWRNKLRKLENSRKLSFMTEIITNNRMRPMRGPNFFTYCRALLSIIVLLWLMS